MIFESILNDFILIFVSRTFNFVGVFKINIIQQQTINKQQKHTFATYIS